MAKLIIEAVVAECMQHAYHAFIFSLKMLAFYIYTRFWPVYTCGM